MDNYTLSEVCYKNGFADGQAQPLYYVISPFGDVQTIGYSLETVRNEILQLKESRGWLLVIYKIFPNSWERPEIIEEYILDDKENFYSLRKEVNNDEN